jgi:hypothetical protein
MRVYLIVVAIALASCAPETQYIRADGRYAAPETIKGALAECGSDSKDNLCMVERGYFIVPADQADAKRTELAAIAEANEQARLAKVREQEEKARAEEEERRAKAKKKTKRAKVTTRAAEPATKQALDAKRRKQTVDRSTSAPSIWSNPPAFSPVAPARR